MATTIGLKLDEETKQRLHDLGAQRDRSAHWLMKQAIHEYLEREERYERERREDETRWQTYVMTGEALSSNEVHQWLDGLKAKARSAQS